MARVIGFALLACLALAGGVVRGQGATDPAASSGLAPWSWPLDAEHREAARGLRESRRAGPGEEGRILEALSRRGVAALPAWFDILERQRVPESTPGDAPQMLSEAQRGLLVAALGRLPAPLVRTRILQRVAARGDAPDLDLRLAAIRVLAVAGEAADLALVARWAPRKPLVDANSPAPLSREGRAALRDAASGILARDARAWPAFEAVLRRSDEHVARALLDGACARRDPRAAEVLLRIARGEPAHALQVASLAPRCGRSSRPEVDADFALWALERAQAVEPDQAHAYLAAVGAFDDGDLAGRLCALAAEDEPRRAQAALSALRAITGLGLGTVEEWLSWLELERTWRATTRPALARDILGGDEAAMARALKALAMRRIQRAELVADVVPALSARKPALRAQACSTLGALKSAAGTDALLVACLDEDEAVRRAARAALRAIHGEPLPEELDLLRVALGL
jgi:hypothetical protein